VKRIHGVWCSFELRAHRVLHGGQEFALFDATAVAHTWIELVRLPGTGSLRRIEKIARAESTRLKRRSTAAWSVVAFGAVMAVQSMLLLVAPVAFLSALHLPPPGDAWPRLAGLALGVIAVYYVFAFVRDDTGFFKLSGFVRVCQFGVFVALYLSGEIVSMLVVTSALELISGVVTLVCIRQEQQAGKLME
jgi:hypothetical protein